MSERTTKLIERGTSAANTTQQRRWLVVRGAHATIQRFADEWTRLPAGAWRAWIVTVIVGWLVSAALMYALMLAFRAWVGDESALLLQIVDRSPLSFHAAIWAESPGNSVFMLPMMLVAATIAVWLGAPLRALSILAAFCLIDTLVLIGWLGWDRARPTLVLDGVATPGFHSFPSGHVAQTIALYGLLSYFWIAATNRRAEQLVAVLLCATLVIVVALARLSLGAHWPSDIVAGAAIGGTWLAVLVTALRWAENRQTERAASDSPA